MGGIKHEQKSSARPEVMRDATGSASGTGHSCLNWFIWTISTITLFGAFGFLYYVQFHEIHKLKTRLDALEIGIAFGEGQTGTDATDIRKIVQKMVEEGINSNVQALKEIAYAVVSLYSNFYAVVSLHSNLLRDGLLLQKLPTRWTPFTTITYAMDSLHSNLLRSDMPLQIIEKETSHDRRSHMTRQVVSAQSCCSALQKPSYIGSRNEVVTSYIGQDVLLPCNSTGFPPPRITLSPAVDPTGTNRYAVTSAGLEILKAQSMDSGTFTCVVENVFGKDIKTLQLIVTDPVVVTTSPSNIAMKDGDTILLRCLATGNPPPTVTWSHSRADGTVLQVIGSVGGRIRISADNTLTITNAKASDSGRYTCTGVNAYEKDSATSAVFLNGKPEIIKSPKTETVMEGNTVTIYCTVVSNPPATVTWHYPLTGANSPLNAHLNPDNSITLSNVDKYNNGAYMCTATNGQGTVTATATLTVEKGVTVTATPNSLPMIGTEPVLNFQCTADGDPLPTTTWSKVGSPSLYGNSKYLILPGGNLIITSPSLNTDTGVYECFGENRNGNYTDRVIVYSDRGAINCSATFNDLGCGLSMTCGATCPSICSTNVPGASVYGSSNYAMDSSVCLSAYHRGFLPTPGNSKVLFTHTPYNTFTSSLSNGIQSGPHIPGDSNEFFRVPSNSGSSGNSLIG